MQGETHVVGLVSEVVDHILYKFHAAAAVCARARVCVDAKIVEWCDVMDMLLRGGGQVSAGFAFF